MDTKILRNVDQFDLINQFLTNFWQILMFKIWILTDLSSKTQIVTNFDLQHQNFDKFFTRGLLIRYNDEINGNYQ